MSIVVDQLSLSLNSGNRLVTDISFDVEAGEVMAIIGPNGAGKTSLLKALSGDVVGCARSGDIRYDDKPIEQWALHQRAQQLSVLPQLSLLNFPYTVKEVVALGRVPHSSGRSIDNQLIEKAMDALDISHLGNRLYPQLSGGEKQRTQLARSIVQISVDGIPDANRYLLLDEPTGSLDLGHQQQLMQVVRSIASHKVTIVMVLHDVSLAARYADKLLALHQGKMIALGTPSEVVTEEHIQSLYGIDVSIIEHPETGRPVVLGV